ncbi:hypothetical protein NECAME_02168 [Necator americanus]|uniref:Uncharacterized protein n=1 Tax=Necator americanus TaxID=51031 RepID=W2TI39_NECAM|nr:hypothetical protein NECAME_02168 [Necator americanus]ETN81488.1 hypothetical protein NECAME_02168 [Necator americanus]
MDHLSNSVSNLCSVKWLAWMCDALAELGEEGNEDYVVFDFFGVGIALVAYGALNYFQETSLYTTLPFVVLLFFAAALPLGVVGLLYQRPNLLVVYNTRLSIVVLWSLAWMTNRLTCRFDNVGENGENCEEKAKENIA